VVGTSHPALALTLGIIAMLAMIPIAAGARSARAHGDWDSTTTFVFLVGILTSLPRILLGLISPGNATVDAFGNVDVALTGWAYRVEQMTTGFLVVGGLLFFAHRCLRPHTRINGLPLIAILLWLTIGLSDGLNHHPMFSPRQLALFALLLAAVVARPGRSALLGAAAVGLLLATLGGVEALVHSDAVFRECRSDKCGPLGTLYTGIFVNENLYGLPLALSVPFIWLAVRGPARIVLAIYVAAIACITGSRTSEIAALAALAVLLALRPSITDDPSTASSPSREAPSARSLLALLTVTGAACAGLVLPFLNLNPDSLSQRVYFWDLARGQISSSPIYGLGSNAWQHLYDVGQIPVALTYSVHNQWLDVLYTGGSIGLFLFVLLLVFSLIRSAPVNLLAAACVLIPFLAASALERPWSFGISDELSFTLLAAMLAPAGRLSPETSWKPFPLRSLSVDTAFAAKNLRTPAYAMGPPVTTATTKDERATPGHAPSFAPAGNAASPRLPRRTVAAIVTLGLVYALTSPRRRARRALRR